MFQSRFFSCVSWIVCGVKHTHSTLHNYRRFSLSFSVYFLWCEKKKMHRFKMIVTAEKNRAESQQQKHNTIRSLMLLLLLFFLQLSCQRYRNSWMHDCFTLSVKTNCTESESEKTVFVCIRWSVWGLHFYFVLVLFWFSFLLCSLAHSGLDIHLFFSRFLRIYSFYYFETLCILINPTQHTWVPWNNDNQSGNETHNKNTLRIHAHTEYIYLFSYRKQ